MTQSQNQLAGSNNTGIKEKNNSRGMGGKLSAIVAASVFALSGCTNDARQVDYSVLPDGLKDCKFYRLQSSTEKNITVVRCPNSSTSTTTSEQAGKTSVDKTTIVIDGSTYEKVTK